MVDISDSNGQRVARNRRRLLRGSVAALLTVTLVGALTTGWVGVRGSAARTHLVAAAGLLQQLQRELTSGDVTTAQRTLAALQAETRQATADTGDPAWGFGASMPGPGADLAAVRVVARALDDLARNAMPPLVEVAGGLDPSTLVPRNGRIELIRLQQAAPRLTAARQALVRVVGQVAAIPTQKLLPQVRSAVTELRGRLNRALTVAETAERAAVLLPAMLGANGPRTYLVLFQNPAEARATGGMPGAFAVISAHHGQVDLVEQGTASNNLKTFDVPVVELTTAMRSFYGDRIATHPANITMTPHFPTTAVLAREMYRRRSGRTVDGVLATDPVALSYLLRATGPVPVAGSATLTAETAVRSLLAGVYATYRTQAEQDRYFAHAAKAAFAAVTRQPGHPRAMLTQLARAAGERRILVWSAHPDEQRSIAGTVLEGALPTDDGARPTVGVFLNDGGGAKLGYYLTQSAELTTGGCRADGGRDLLLRVTLGSTAPTSGLPPNVLSYRLVPHPYATRTYVLVFSPAGGGIVNARLDGVATPVSTGTERGRSVAQVTVDVNAGTSRTVEMRLYTGAAGVDVTARPRLWTTPMTTPWKIKADLPDECPQKR